MAIKNLDEKYQEQAAYEMGYNAAINYEPMASVKDYSIYVSDHKYYQSYKQGYCKGKEYLFKNNA